MPAKRIINKKDYPMVTPEGWEIYKNTSTILPCKCDGCGKIIYRSISTLDRLKTCFCTKCGYKNLADSKRRIINKEDYPPVIDWSEYEDTYTKLPCKCDRCGCIVPKTINNLDAVKRCLCYECGRKMAVDKTKRIINKKDYPMVTPEGWEIYETTHTPLPCICEGCGCNVYKSINTLDICKTCFCKKCSVLKRNETKHKNGTFGISNPEDQCHYYLNQLYSESNVKRNYNKDLRYPFQVDFYIIPTDTFIECNFFWAHGKEPFDPENEEHQRILNKWVNKQKKSYNDSIEIWTIRDPLKIKTAQDNNLNYLMFYTMEDFETWIKNCNFISNT